MISSSTYRPGREIARGGMGAVLDARDPKLSRSVAMKVMLRDNASEGEQQRFLLEARVLGQLAHPNIVPVHDLGTDEKGRVFYVMKLVQGVTLEHVIGSLRTGDQETLAKYPLNALLTVFQKVCDAMGFAHSRGIIHRDLKPANIMVGEFGEVLVMDWGLAKIMPGSVAADEAASLAPGLPGQSGPMGAMALGRTDGDSLDFKADEQVTMARGDNPEDQATMATGSSPQDEATIASGSDEATAPPKYRFDAKAVELEASSGSYQTLDGAVMGTPHYMSPEQAEGRITELDSRSDIFSLGGILYTLLTLRPPADGDSLEEILAKVRSANIAVPTEFNTSRSSRQAKPGAAGSVVEPGKIFPLGHCPDGRVPAALSSVTMKALKRDKASRYQDVREFAAEIVAYQGGFATTAENAGALKLVRLFIQRHRVLAVATSLVVLLSMGFVVKLLASQAETQRQARIALANEKKAEASAAEAKAEAQLAREAEKLAEKRGEAARQALARSVLSLTDAALREGDGATMQVLLNDVPEDLRDSTWHYLFAQSDTSIARVHGSSAQSIGVAAHPRIPGIFAVPGKRGWVTLMDVRTGAKRLEFKVDFEVEQLVLAFSPDGGRIAIGALRSQDAGIAIHDARDGSKLAAWAAPLTKKLEFSPDGNALLQKGESSRSPIPNIVNVWDLASGKLRWSSKSEHAAFTPDGQHVLLSSASEKLRLVKALDGSLVRSLSSIRATSIAIRPDGKMALVVTSNFSAIGVSMEDGDVLFEFAFQLDEGAIRHLAFTSDGGRFVTASSARDGRLTLKLRDANTGSVLQNLLGGDGTVAALAVHPLSGELFVSGSKSRVWSLSVASELWSTKSRGRTSEIAFWGSDDLVLLNNGAVWNLNSAPPVQLREGIKNPGGNSSVSADGRFAAVSIGSKEDVRYLVLRKAGSLVEDVAVVNGLKGGLRQWLGPTGDRLLILGTIDGRIARVDADASSGDQPVELERTGKQRLRDVRWINEQRVVGLVTANGRRGHDSSEECVRLWNADTGKLLHTTTNSTAMDVLAIAPTGSRFAEAGVDKRVRIRDSETLNVLQDFRAHDGPITALAWHPTKPILATASTDRSIRLWDLETGRRLEEIRDPLAALQVLAFSPSGRRLAGGETGRRNHIWEPKSLKLKR
jgi:serine/threonine protein kinase/WD40 repeat protein